MTDSSSSGSGTSPWFLKHLTEDKPPLWTGPEFTREEWAEKFVAMPAEERKKWPFREMGFSDDKYFRPEMPPKIGKEPDSSSSSENEVGYFESLSVKCHVRTFPNHTL